MKINVTKNAKFEVEFFAKSVMNRDWWTFALPTIIACHFNDVTTIHFLFAFWCAGIDVSKVIKEHEPKDPEENEKD